MIPILYEDAAVAVCQKLAGLLSQGGEGMEALLRAQTGGEIFPVHRLDRAVGGVMVYAKTRQAAAALSAAIARGALEKEYFAVAEGEILPEQGRWEDLLFHDQASRKAYVVRCSRAGVRRAALEYQVLARAALDGGTFSLCAVRLLTGRFHQIRVQFAHRGHPLFGDGKYGSRRKGALALFSHSLRFPHPVSGEEMRFSLPMPEGIPWDCFRDAAQLRQNS